MKHDFMNLTDSQVPLSNPVAHILRLFTVVLQYNVNL
jgi:hypothetical protein